MALSFQTDDGTIYRPGAYAKYTVAAVPSGTATSGILVLIGESSQGPDFSAETDLSNAFFGPTQGAEVAAKYGSGNIVDAFNIAAVPASDPEITGSPAGVYILKTNKSGKASANLLRSGLSNYGVIADQNYGEPGNGLSFTVSENAPEVAPVLNFTYVATPASTNLGLRVNGGASQAISNGSLTSPTAFVASINALSGAPVQAAGGVTRDVMLAFGGTETLALAVSGNNVTITSSKAWDNTPLPGDLLVIPSQAGSPAWYQSAVTSSVVGAGLVNEGFYVITAATGTTISATKVHDIGAESVTPPVAVSAATIGSIHDLFVASAVSVTNMTGTARAVVATVSGTVAGVASGASLTLTRSIPWDAQPAVNDLVQIPSTAPAAWLVSGANTGFYRVTASSATTVTMTKLDTTVSPASFSATSQAASSDLVCRRPAIDGVGKDIELNSTTDGNAVVFSSTASALLPLFAVSAAEQQDTVINSKLSQNLSEQLVFGGTVMLLLGYTGTSATVTITNSQLTTAVVGGVGANLTINLKNYKTIADLASFINSQPGYSCAPANNLLGQTLLFPDKNGVLILDKGTFGICSTVGNKAGRIKKDARDFFVALRDSSQLLQVGSPVAAQPNAGLPEAQGLTFLTGGTRGGTSDLNIVNALVAAQRLRLNFVCPLFSRDASKDIVDLLTDSSSTYTIDAIHANVKSHVIAMSTLKRRRNRQAFLSFQGSFTDWKAKNATLASFRCSCAGQDFKGASSVDGSIVQFQPWATAVDAAATQAAGFYRSIELKGLNTSGILYNDSTFHAEDDDDVDIALQSGCLVAAPPEDTGIGFEWVSDQTTYGVDNNFVFNSIQAVYAADLITLTSAQKMERGLVGKSLADVSSATASSLFGKIMGELKRLKLIASSDDAPAGFKNATFKIVGNTMLVSAEVKLAVALSFVSITFVVTQVQQSSSI